MEVDNVRIAERIRTEIFLPALRQAAKDAKKLNCSANDMLNGSMMAIGDMLLTLTGKEGAVLLLNGLADYLKNNQQADMIQ